MIRPARLDELDALTALMHRSKAHWGYDERFMAAARAVLVLELEDLCDGALGVVDHDGVKGLCHLIIDRDRAGLDKLFVEPNAIGTGVGRALMDWAIETARARGAPTMQIESDPDAAPFYQRMGARFAGRVPSDAIKGRMLPLLQIDLSDLAAGAPRSI